MYPVETMRFPRTTTALMNRLSQLAFCLTATAILIVGLRGARTVPLTVLKGGSIEGGP